VKRIGVLGGTFDPPHIGHLIIAEAARMQLKLDCVLWVLTANPPHKRGHSISPVEIRAKLVKAAISGNAAFVLSLVDVERPGPHYAVDTLPLLRSQFPASEIFYLIGGDSLRDLPKWKEPQRLIQTMDQLAVVRRPRVRYDLTNLEIQIPGIRNKLVFVNAPLIDISATLVRQRIHENGAFRYFLPPAVYNLVVELNLYRILEDDDPPNE
jgi:nicotinate-nucleotide adenylyltransferase